jgi:hypothetical protein
MHRQFRNAKASPLSAGKTLRMETWIEFLANNIDDARATDFVAA